MRNKTSITAAIALLSGVLFAGTAEARGFRSPFNVFSVSSFSTTVETETVETTTATPFVSVLSTRNFRPSVRSPFRPTVRGPFR